jgi:hypothetical protein
VRFLAAGQGLACCVEEHFSTEEEHFFVRYFWHLQVEEVGVLILSPGIKQSVRFEQELNSTFTIDEFTEGNYDWIILCPSNQLIYYTCTVISVLIDRR